MFGRISRLYGPGNNPNTLQFKTVLEQILRLNILYTQVERQL